jgi:CO/xanthine dehydrogenase Mo-binding subunit
MDMQTDELNKQSLRDLRYIGKPIERGEAIHKVTGKWVYGTDFTLPGMLFGKALRSPYPHARIISINLDRARKLRGVRAAIVGDDLPYLFGSSVRDEPFIARNKVRYAGEPVAAIAAVDEETAREAIDLIEVEYEELPAVFDALEAMKPNSVLVHEDLQAYAMDKKYNPHLGTNIIHHTKIRAGDIEQGFRESDEVFEDVFTTQYVQHCSLEAHVAVAQVDPDGGVVIWSSCQSPYNCMRDMADALGLPCNMVRVVCTGIGGGFGGKNFLRLEPLLVALAKYSDGRPVKYAFSRDEEFIASVHKHPAHLTFKTGVKRDGTLVARKITAVFNTGAYADAGPLVARNGAFSGSGPYRIPHVWADSYCVYTNSPLGGAFRGFGVPQLTWAHESQMDMIANRLGLDPIDIRLCNLLELGDATCTGEVLRTSVGVKETLQQAVEVSDYRSAIKPAADPKIARGRGVATMHKMTNTPTTSVAVLKMHRDGTVNVLCSTVELGQGINTTLRQIVAEGLGAPIENIRIRVPDTDYTPYDKSTSGSRSVFHMGNALLRAVDDLAKKLCTMAASQMGCSVADVEYRDGLVWRKHSTKYISPKDLIEAQFGDAGTTIQGEGSFTPSGAQAPDKETGRSRRASGFWMYGTHVVDVEVDLETGKIKLLRIVAVHDAGTIINPEGAKGQIIGGVVQGIGTALYEEMVVKDGIVTNPTFGEYKLPTTMDVPEIVPVFVETYHDEGPYGAKGLSEPALGPVPAAIANAIFNATGARVTSLPITPEKILHALQELKNGHMRAPGVERG